MEFALSDSLKFFMPEMVLVATAVLILIFELVFGRRYVPVLALLGLVVAGGVAWLMYQSGISGYLFSGTVAMDSFSLFFKLLFLSVAVITVLFSMASGKGITFRGEYYAILLIATFGMMILASASDILMLYISLETISISSYILVSFLKGNKKSSEAGLKYVIYGAIASGLMIYGMSMIYGLTGTTSFVGISQALTTHSSLLATHLPILLVMTILVMAGLCYKIAAVPFHMWCPDVYEGAPTPITAFLSVGPKAAGFAIIIRFFFGVFSHSTLHASLFTPINGLPWRDILAVICVLTMTIGNLGALWQNNVKRLLAYSSIAHAGYILMGVVLLTTIGLQAVLMYLAIYLFMNLGAFLVVIIFSEVIGSDDIKDYKGLGWRFPWPCVVMTIFLFSLTGLPPLAGFIGKLYIFAAVIKEGWYWLAIIGVINTVISLYYYTRIVRAMFMEGIPDSQSAIRNPQSTIPLYYSLMLFVLVLPILVLGVYWSPLVEFTSRSISFLR